MKRAAVVAALAAGALALPAAGAAHVQVSPGVAAPGDPTLFTLLVPNESDNPTVRVNLAIPDGVIPFSFEETAGWTRSEQLADDGSLDMVTWTGSLPAGGFVRFSLLARTPDEARDVAWPTLQHYADGTVVRWIGPPGSDEPAAVTTISPDAPRQNAGGEGGEPAPGATEPSGGSTEPAGQTTETVPGETSTEQSSMEPAQTEAAPVVIESGDGDSLALGLSILALALAAIAVVALITRRGPKQ